MDSTESLQRLVDNVEFVNVARYGTVTIEDGGTKLVYNGLAGGRAEARPSRGRGATWCARIIGDIAVTFGFKNGPEYGMILPCEN